MSLEFTRLRRRHLRNAMIVAEYQEAVELGLFAAQAEILRLHPELAERFERVHVEIAEIERVGGARIECVPGRVHYPKIKIGDLGALPYTHIVAEDWPADWVGTEPYRNGSHYGGNFLIGESIVQEVALRLVVCWNACEGIADPTSVPELIAALRAFVDYYERHGGEGNLATPVMEYRVAKLVLSKIDGGA